MLVFPAVFMRLVCSKPTLSPSDTPFKQIPKKHKKKKKEFGEDLNFLSPPALLEQTATKSRCLFYSVQAVKFALIIFDVYFTRLKLIDNSPSEEKKQLKFQVK